MRQLILFMILFKAVSLSAQVQFESLKPSVKGFDVSSGTDIQQVIMIDDTAYDVFQTSGGANYIKCTSPRTNNVYAVWIGTATDHKHEGRDVRQSSSGKHFILIKSKNTGNPYPKYLKIKK